MQSGKAPVCVHDVYNAIATCPSGIRPLPVKEGESAMRAPPVRIVLHENGQSFTLEPSSWVLVPHVSANRDEDKGPLAPEQKAALVFHVRIPKGYKIVPDEPAPVPEPLPEPEPVRESIPELAAVDPAIFRANPEAVNAALREIAKKGKP